MSHLQSIGSQVEEISALQMHKEERQFTQEYNLAVIKLIKHKFLPLQRPKASLHAIRHSLLSSHCRDAKSCHIEPQASLPSIPALPNHGLAKSESEYNVLQKARQYIDNKKRAKPNRNERVELKQYIELFEKPVDLKGLGKRGSIEFKLMEIETRNRLEPLMAVSTNNEEVEMNQEERSIMNAKIRRKLNHKKIIDLGKRY